MDKFSFKMKDRIKLVVERTSTQFCTLTISGKEDVMFRLSRKRAKELIKHLQSVLIYGTADKVEFKKNYKAPAGSFILTQTDLSLEEFCLTIYKDDVKIFFEAGLSRKWVKKMIKYMKEVYDIE